MPEFTILDADGSTIGFTRTPNARSLAGFVPATGNRLLHPELAATAREAAVAVHTGRNAEFWEAVRTMDEPEGIRSSLA